MGILQTIELNSGVIVDNAYSRIESFSGTKDSLTFTLAYYVNRDAIKNGLPYITQMSHTCNVDIKDGSPNCIKQGYIYLKTLPEFQGAIDVLEDN